MDRFNASPARYALYFTPDIDSAFGQAGHQWLAGEIDIPGLSATAVSDLTNTPRHYGFHATLKAPFKLSADTTQAQLCTAANKFVQSEHAIALQGLQVSQLGHCLVLSVSGDNAEIAKLAMRCVKHFDVLRAAADTTELAKRRKHSLNARQEALLMQWGYPFVEDLFHFHMTLSSDLSNSSSEQIEKLHKAATKHFEQVLSTSIQKLDALSICVETTPSQPFTLLHRYTFGDT